MPDAESLHDMDKLMGGPDFLAGGPVFDILPIGKPGRIQHVSMAVNLRFIKNAHKALSAPVFPNARAAFPGGFPASIRRFPFQTPRT